MTVKVLVGIKVKINSLQCCSRLGRWTHTLENIENIVILKVKFEFKVTRKHSLKKEHFVIKTSLFILE